MPEFVGSGQRLALFRIVERVIETSHRPAGVAECGMAGNIGNALPIDVGAAFITQAIQVARPSSSIRLIVAAEAHLAFGYMPAAVTHLIPFEMLNFVEMLRGFWPVANLGHRAFVPMVWMEAVVYVAPKVFVTMKPRAHANEDATRKPLRAVVAVRSTRVRRNVIVTVRTHRGLSNADGDLSVHFRNRHGEENSSHRSQSEIFQWVHNCPLIWRDPGRY
jgi:hypothetical protein